MVKNKKEIGRFGFAIRVFEDTDKKSSFENEIFHINVPDELVLMQLWKFLKNKEIDYVHDFDEE